jgi:hypothetical protein
MIFASCLNFEILGKIIEYLFCLMDIKHHHSSTSKSSLFHFQARTTLILFRPILLQGLVLLSQTYRSQQLICGVNTERLHSLDVGERPVAFIVASAFHPGHQRPMISVPDPVPPHRTPASSPTVACFLAGVRKALICC